MASHAQFGSADTAGRIPTGRPTDNGAVVGPPGARPAVTWSLTTAGLGVIAAAFALLAGGWLMYAPFGLGYQSDFGTWSDATKTDFWDGFGLAVLGLLALVLTGLGLIGVLRQAGVITARPRSVEPPDDESAAAVPASVPGDDLTSVLRPLLEALERDNAEAASALPRRPDDVPAPVGPHPAGPQQPSAPRPASPPYPASSPYPPGGPYPASTSYPAGTSYPTGDPYPAGKE